MHKRLAFVGLGLMAALSCFSACEPSQKAGIVLNVTTAPGVDRAAISELQVTVDGKTQPYAVGNAATWSLGIETGAGSKTITP